MKCVVVCDGKRHGFTSLLGLAIQTENQLWVYDENSDKTKELRFIPAYPGWKARSGKAFRDFIKAKFGTQANAAKQLQYSQTSLSAVVRGEREFPVDVWMRYLERKRNQKTLSKEDVTGYLGTRK